MQTGALLRSVPFQTQATRLFIRCLTALLLFGGAARLRGQSASADLLKILTGTNASESSAAANPPADLNKPAPFYVKQGPWGKLQYFYIYIEAPESVVNELPMPNTLPRWSFLASDAARLPALFKEAGLPKSFSAALLDPARQVTDADKLHLFPPLEMLEAMTPAMREVIYPELAKVSENEYHASPVLITTDTVEEWYRSSKLPPELLPRIRQMAYKRGKCNAFSDVPAILNHAKSDSEARLIFKIFTRSRALMVKLELTKGDADINGILNYWTTGLGLRRKDVEPIIQSIVETDGADRLDLVHILPALARKLLYTYPGAELSRQGILPDCHWTSLNFFNYSPHEYLLDGRLATSSVLENFRQVSPPYQYGDILFFLDTAKGDAFHSCVYLAADIVFTKNGRNALSPWTLMKLDEVEKIYLYGGNGRLQGYRHKDAIGDARKQ